MFKQVNTNVVLLALIAGLALINVCSCQAPPPPPAGVAEEAADEAANEDELAAEEGTDDDMLGFDDLFEDPEMENMMEESYDEFEANMARFLGQHSRQ